MKMNVFLIPVSVMVNVTWMEPLTSVNVQEPGKEQPAAVSVTMEKAWMAFCFSERKKTDVPPQVSDIYQAPSLKNGGNVGDHVAWVACEHRHVFPADPVTTGNKSAFVG